MRMRMRMRMNNDAAGVETVERLEGNSANYGRRQRYVWSDEFVGFSSWVTWVGKKSWV